MLLSSLVFIAVARSALAAVPLWGQCGGEVWEDETVCVDGATCVVQNPFYSQCLAGTAAPTSTKPTSAVTSSTPTSSVSTKPTSSVPTSTVSTGPIPSGITTVIPASAGYTALPTARVIAAGASFDGKLVKFDRKGSDGTCQDQVETDEAAAVFILEAGATISNVIIGKEQAEGIHCRGPCTLNNIWWEDVCEDAATFKQLGASSVSTVNGGGAFGASDKIFQHNGEGTVKINNFYASSFGKLYRACGNCSSSYKRHVEVNNVCLKDGKEGVGINTNWGDTAKLTNIKSNQKPTTANTCCTYKGVAKGSEPSKIGCGSGYSACAYNGAVGTC